MKNLLVFASAVMVGSAVFAGQVPRVYQYSASVNTAVAKYASKVTYYDADGDKLEYTDGICYRVKGSLTIKGVIVLGCDCNEFEGWGEADWNWDGERYTGYRTGFEEAIWDDVNEEYDWEDTLATSYPIVLMATSADKYKQVVFAGEVDGNTNYYPNLDVWVANRLGAPTQDKAKVAELGFDIWFDAGLEDVCDRSFSLWNAGFGSAAVLDKSDNTLDISSISGSVVGWSDAPFCSAADNNCPRCLETGTCEYAIAFTPCFDNSSIGNGDGNDWGVVSGSFSLKFSSTLSKLLYNVPEENIQATIFALVPKAFGSSSIPPVLPLPPVVEEVPVAE